ncbi:MAG: MarR family winged helix-turn-helix transcriptional regulator [Candidatus Aquicultorales bacterium]
MDKRRISERAQELESAMRALKRANFMGAKDDSGLKGSEKHFIWALKTINDGRQVMPSEAAKKLQVTLGAVTHYINSLEEQGFIVREASPTDKRVVLVSLSPKGQEVVTALKKIYFGKIRGLVEYLGDQDSAELTRLLKKISEFFEIRQGTEELNK